MTTSARGASPALVGRRFHSTVVEIIARACLQMESVTVLRAVMLSGGVFLNALLRTEATDRLAREEFRVHRHVRVPPGDGGLCLGSS